MGKKERKIEAIKKSIRNISTYSWYTYGSIPNRIASNACSSYGGNLSASNILGIVDTSITGNGKTGLIFAEYGVYFNNGMFGSTGYIAYREIAKTGKISGEIFSSNYNRQALIELLSVLSDIEGKDLEGTLGDINKGIDDINKAIDDVGEIVEKGLDLLSRFLK